MQANLYENIIFQWYVYEYSCIHSSPDKKLTYVTDKDEIARYLLRHGRMLNAKYKVLNRDKVDTAKFVYFTENLYIIDKNYQAFNKTFTKDKMNYYFTLKVVDDKIAIIGFNEDHMERGFNVYAIHVYQKVIDNRYKIDTQLYVRPGIQEETFNSKYVNIKYKQIKDLINNAEAINCIKRMCIN